MIKNFRKRFKPMKAKEVERVAYHEAGHAFLAFHYDIPMTKVSIIKNSNYLGFVRYDGRSKTRIKDGGYLDDLQLIKHSSHAVAGLISEALFCGKINLIGANSDFKQVLNKLAGYMPYEEERDLFVDWILIRVFNFLSMRQNWPIIENFAMTLLERKEMSKEEIYDTFYNFRSSISNFKYPPGLHPDWIEKKIQMSNI